MAGKVLAIRTPPDLQAALTRKICEGLLKADFPDDMRECLEDIATTMDYFASIAREAEELDTGLLAAAGAFMGEIDQENNPALYAATAILSVLASKAPDRRLTVSLADIEKVQQEIEGEALRISRDKSGGITAQFMPLPGMPTN